MTPSTASAASHLRVLPSDDADLVDGARRGDPSAFDALYARHAGRVFAVCLRMTADRVRAAELTQDVFVLAWRGLPGFRGDAQLASWLHRLAVNAVLADARARRRRESRVSLAEDEDDVPAGTAAAAAADDRMDLEAALTRLPDGARRVFVLHDVEGYTHDEIAALLGCTSGTCRTQLHRARRRLMELLDR